MRLIAWLLCATVAWAPVQAQINPAVTAALIPSPLGVVLTLGQWLVLSNNKRVYYIEVAGRGDTLEQARNNGFRLAVEQALGTLISSETEVVNGRIQRDEIISYAAGYVDRFEIVNTEYQGRQAQVTMRVWVSRSALADRLLNRTEASAQIDGPRASVQLQTLNQERATGDALLQQVLNDFPKRAFDIELKNTDISRHNRNAVVEVNFRLKWSQDYLRSLCAVLEATDQKISANQRAASIWVNGGGWFSSAVNCAARYDDTRKFELLAHRMHGLQPTVLVSLRGPAREIIHTSCYMYQELDNYASGHVTAQRFVQFNNIGATINGTYVLPGRIPIAVRPDQLHMVNQVEIDVVLRAQCPTR